MFEMVNTETVKVITNLCLCADITFFFSRSSVDGKVSCASAVAIVTVFLDLLMEGVHVLQIFIEGVQVIQLLMGGVYVLQLLCSSWLIGTAVIPNGTIFLPD